MARRLDAAAWLFSLSVAILDVAFAFHHKETFPQWEANPVAAYMGFWPAVAVRVATMAAALSLYFALPPRPGRTLTWAVFVVHLFLLVYYGVCQW